MKKYLISLLTLFLIPLTVLAKDNDKVKVYLFEAGGCPYCEMQVEYLENLDSYNKKFEIVRKQAFIDHVDWEPGEDYDLGNKVASAFTAAGMPAEMSGTPFVVISDLYAKATYSESLETIIDQAYEEGDKDVVQCIADGKDNCIKSASSSSNDSTALMIIVLLIFLVTYVVKSELDKRRILAAIYAKKSK